jgi:anti-sigma B factor antagonist
MKIKYLDKVTVISPPQRLELSNFNDLKVAFAEAIAKNNNNIIFNLDKLEYINSSNLGEMISSLKKMKDAGRELVLSNIHEKLIQLLKVINIYDIFEKFSTEDDAILKFSDK